MTIAVSVKVNDGVVLASDSASSLVHIDDKNLNVSIMNVYEHADKIFNLYKELPVGVVSWGAGGIGKESISTLAKDFRKLIQKDGDFEIDNNEYSIKEIAYLFNDFFQKKYNAVYRDLKLENSPGIGFIVAGYSSDENLPEEYIMEISKKNKNPELIRPKDQGGAAWFGQPEAIFRIVKGYSGVFPDMLLKMGVPEKDVKIIIEESQKNIEASLIHDAMPIKDAIDLAKFLVELTINFVRFNPGAQTVGGAIDIASITKHEGFKWINRKHYYQKDINI